MKIDLENEEAIKAIRRYVMKQGKYFREDVLLMEIRSVVDQAYPPTVHKHVIFVGENWDWQHYNAKHLDSLRSTPARSLMNKATGLMREIFRIRS